MRTILQISMLFYVVCRLAALLESRLLVHPCFWATPAIFCDRAAVAFAPYIGASSPQTSRSQTKRREFPSPPVGTRARPPGESREEGRWGPRFLKSSFLKRSLDSSAGL